MTPTAIVPFSEPSYLNNLPSPYHNDSHRAWQKACKAFIGEHLLSQALEWEEAGTVPEHVFHTFAKHGMLLPAMPAPLPVKWLHKLGIKTLLGVLKVEDFDYIHAAIYADEMGRLGVSGPSSSLLAGTNYGIPPIVKFGSAALQEKVLPDLLTGRKRACIAITEPSAGSDVANISTTATKTADGKFYIINGSKKWITNGFWADYTTMVVRTGGPGAKGLSMIVVPLKGHAGVTMRRMKVGGFNSSGTTFIELDDVKVPVENLVGEEGKGMSYTMTNFNHERLCIAIGATRQARVALSTAFAYTMKREAFGKALIQQPVVRHRLAKAGSLLESLQAWIDQTVYQLTKLSKEEADARLGGITSLMKAQAGIVLSECAQCAVLLFGGNGYTRDGQGEIVERIYRDVNGIRIPGGSEDVMLDLGVRQLLKLFERETKMLQGSGGDKSKL